MYICIVYKIIIVFKYKYFNRYFFFIAQNTIKKEYVKRLKKTNTHIIYNITYT